MKFKVGQKVVIRRNLGKKSGNSDREYYHGGYVGDVPLGTKAVIDEICGKDRILIILKNRNRSWYVHPNELGTIKEQIQAEKEQQEKYNPILEKALLNVLPESQVEQVVEKKIEKPFTPKFNAKEEFVIWVREQFPELKKYAKSKKTYFVLSKRIKEVKKAAQEAWRGVEKARSKGGHTPDCHRTFLRPYFKSFYDSIFYDSINHSLQGRNKKNYAPALDTLVRALEVSGTSNFPYNSAARDFRGF